MTQQSVIPNPDSIEEVRVLQNNFSAQYSLLGSSVILVQTKSGTANLHGTVWEFLRNDDLNAKPYLLDARIPPYKQNIFGFNVGGPVFIPHVYNTDRKKTFFFWDESYVVLHVPSQTTSQLPTPNQIAGCFTSPIKDPATGLLFPTVSTCNGATGTFYQVPSGENQYQFRGVPEDAVSGAQLLAPRQHQQLHQQPGADDLSAGRPDQDRPLLHAQLPPAGRVLPGVPEVRAEHGEPTARRRSARRRTLPTTSWRRSR